MANELLDLNQVFPCPRCGTTAGLRVIEKHLGFAIACTCGICTIPKSSLEDALEFWETEAAVADMMLWDSSAPHKVVDELLRKPLGSEV